MKQPTSWDFSIVPVKSENVADNRSVYLGYSFIRNSGVRALSSLTLRMLALLRLSIYKSWEWLRLVEAILQV